jgi:hypothetical protein
LLNFEARGNSHRIFRLKTQISLQKKKGSGPAQRAVQNENVEMQGARLTEQAAREDF